MATIYKEVLVLTKGVTTTLGYVDKLKTFCPKSLKKKKKRGILELDSDCKLVLCDFREQTTPRNHCGALGWRVIVVWFQFANLA